MVSNEKVAKEDDWFNELDAQLEEQTQTIIKDMAELNNQKRTINRALIEDYWRILVRFSKINVHFTMEPSHSAFATFMTYPDEWKFKDDFNFAGVNNIQLVDRTQEQGRMGDSLKVWYYNDDTSPRVRMVFEFCEGEHYYKYAGWKRVFGQFVVYDAPLSDFSIEDIHGKLGDVVKAWYESHLRRNREFLIDHLKSNYEKGETFTE